mgnify:CR=1 FL=1
MRNLDFLDLRSCCGVSLKHRIGRHVLRAALSLGLVFVFFMPAPIMAMQSIVPKWSRIPDREARMELARLLSLNRDTLPQAEEQYALLFEDDPNDPRVLLGLSAVFMQRQEHLKALALTRDFSVDQLEDASHLLEAVALLTNLGHACEARDIAMELVKRHQDELDLRLRIASLMLAWGDFYRSETILRGILAHPELDARIRRAALLQLGKTLLAAQRYEQADGVLQSLLLRDRRDREVWLALVRLRIEEKDFTGALRMLSDMNSSAASDPSEHHAAEALRLQAQAEFLSGDLEAALTIQEHVCVTYGNQPDDDLALARTLLRLERADRAVWILEALLARNPDDVEARFLWASLQPFVQSVVMQPAFLAALRRDVRSPQQLTRWAELYARAGAHAQAAACYEAALKLDPKYFPARLGLAETSASNRNYRHALNILAALIEDMPMTSKLLLTRARVLSWAQRYEDALAVYDALHLLQPEDPVPLREAARVAMWNKQIGRAETLYQTMQASKDLQEMLAETQSLSSLIHEPETSTALAELENELRRGRVSSGFALLEETFFRRREEFQSGLADRMERLLVDLRPTYRIQKAAQLEEQAKMLAWKRRFMSAQAANQELLDVQPGNQEALFDLAQAQCILGLHDHELNTIERLVHVDPLHNRAGAAMERIALRSRLGLRAGYGYWNEQSQGGSRLAAMERHHGELALELPLQTARYHLFAAQHFWTERPKSLADAREDYAGSYAAQGQTMGLRGVFSPWLRGNFSFTRKDYSKALLGKRDLGQAGLEVNLWDYARLGLEYERMEELANGFSLRQKVMSHVWRATASSSLTRRLDLGLVSEFKEMNDDNQGLSVRGDLGFLVTDHPRELKITLSGEHRDFQKNSSYTYLGANLEDITHPYWTPQNYYSGTVGLQWRHDLAELFFCGAGQHVYTLKLFVGTDSDGNPGVRMEGAYHFDFAKQWSLIAQGLIHRSRQWDAEGLWLGVGYRF